MFNRKRCQTATRWVAIFRTIKVMAPDVELAAGETLTIEGNELVLGNLAMDRSLGTFNVEIVGLATATHFG